MAVWLHELEKRMPSWFPNDGYAKVTSACAQITGLSDAKFINMKSFTPSATSLADVIRVPYWPACHKAAELYTQCMELLEINCQCSPSKDEMMLLAAVTHRLLYPVVSLSIVEEALEKINTLKVRKSTVDELRDLACVLGDKELNDKLKLHVCKFMEIIEQRVCDITNKEVKICSVLTTKQKQCMQDPLAITAMLLKSGYIVALSVFLCEWMHGTNIESSHAVAYLVLHELKKWVFCDSEISRNIIYSVHALGYRLPSPTTAFNLYDPLNFEYQQMYRVQKDVYALQQQPLSLQHWCRITIRRAITHDGCVSTAVHTLPVPGVIARYVCMDEYRMQSEVALVDYKEVTFDGQVFLGSLHSSSLHSSDFVSSPSDYHSTISTEGSSTSSIQESSDEDSDEDIIPVHTL